MAVRWLIACVMVLASWSSALAQGRFVDQARWYADGDSARDGDGSPLSPFNNLASLVDALNQGSKHDKTIHLAGTFRGPGLVMVNLMNCTFQQWQGRTQAVIRGDTIITQLWTEESAGLRYSVPIPGSGPQASVVEDWDVRIDSDGRHFGHMKPVSSISEVEATPASWFFDGRLLHVHASNDENPNRNGRVYARCAMNNGMFLINMQLVTVEGIHFKLWVDRTVGVGYAIEFANTHQCVIRNCQATDYGYHAMGFVGPMCFDNVFDQCVSRGGRHGSWAYVFYASLLNVSGCRAFDCTTHMYPLLDTGGDALEGPAAAANGFYAHCGTRALLTDIECRRCTAVGYSGFGGWGFSAGLFSTEPVNLDDPQAYPVRFYDCSMVNGASNAAAPAARMAFVRCDFDLLHADGIDPVPSVAFYTDGGFGTTRLLFQSCILRTNTEPFASKSCFRVATSTIITLQGCTIYDDGTDSMASRSIFRLISSTSAIRARQCVFIHRTPQFLSIGQTPPFPIQNQSFDHCWYFNIRPADGYSPLASIASQAAFATQVDPGGIYNLNPVFADPPADLEGTAGEPLATTQNPLSGANWLGINLEPYNGYYGAYQYGPIAGCTADLNGSGSVDSLDLGILLASWSLPAGSPGCHGVMPCPADLDHSSQVTSLDLGILLSQWGNCP